MVIALAGLIAHRRRLIPSLTAPFRSAAEPEHVHAQLPGTPSTN